MNGISAPTLRTISSVMITSIPIVSSARLFWSALRALASSPRSISSARSAAEAMPAIAASGQPTTSLSS